MEDGKACWEVHTFHSTLFFNPFWCLWRICKKLCLPISRHIPLLISLWVTFAHWFNFHIPLTCQIQDHLCSTNCMIGWTSANHVLLKIMVKNHFNIEASISSFLKSRQIYIVKCADVLLLHQTPLQTSTKPTPLKCYLNEIIENSKEMKTLRVPWKNKKLLFIALAKHTSMAPHRNSKLTKQLKCFYYFCWFEWNISFFIHKLYWIVFMTFKKRDQF